MRIILWVVIQPRVEPVLLTLDELRMVVAALAAEDVDYALIGAAALNAHGIVRATEDIDIMVRATPENIDRLRRAPRSVWHDPAIDEITAEDLGGAYPAIRYGPPSGELYLDLISRCGDSFDYGDVDSQPVDLGGVTARVATPGALYRMKKDTVRPIDHADAAMLQQRFGLKEE